MIIKTEFEINTEIHFISKEGLPSKGTIKSINVEQINNLNKDNFVVFYELWHNQGLIKEKDIFETPQEVYAELEQRRKNDI